MNNPHDCIELTQVAILIQVPDRLVVSNPVSQLLQFESTIEERATLNTTLKGIF